MIVAFERPLDSNCGIRDYLYLSQRLEEITEPADREALLDAVATARQRSGGT